MFRALKITGNPVIPREVRLSDGASLRGWSAGLYRDRMALPLSEQAAPDQVPGENANHRIPDVLAAAVQVVDSRGSRIGGSAIGPDGSSIDHDWFAKDGIIYGSRREPKDGAVAESGLHYFRPLLAGESITYEFRYEPGKHEVHPALGRLAFLIEPSEIPGGTTTHA